MTPNSDEQYARMRHGVACVLYARNRVAGELSAMRADVARIEDGMRAALEAGDEGAARELALRKADRSTSIARAARALAEIEREASEATAALLAARDAMRARDRDRLLARVTALSVEREVERIGGR